MRCVTPRLGGSEDEPSVFDDGLDAIAVPVLAAGGVHAAINLVWPRRYDLRAKVVEAHLGELRARRRRRSPRRSMA